LCFKHGRCLYAYSLNSYREKFSTSSFRAPQKHLENPQKHLENPQKHIEFPTSDVFLPLYGPKKEERTLCLGLFPLRYYKDNTFSREKQIALTFRNNPRNVKRRVLHTRGVAMCYITRPGSLRALSFNGRCAPWFQRSFQLLVSVGDCVPWFQRSLAAASSIALIRYR
ncbi:MAG: hypothetical protein ACI3X8_05055, partial [Alloprevotella sp.]